MKDNKVNTAMAAFDHRPFAARLVASVLAVGLVAGCATPPPADDKEAVAEYQALNDPLEPTNRAIFEFNQVIDRVLLKPVAKGYRAGVPKWGRDRVHDFLTNLRSPIIFVNDLLQGEPDRAADTVARFVMNTSIGLAGLFDVADEAGIRHHDEDFGQTLAVWGVTDGPYLVLPILGPSNLRDTGGLVAEWVVDPVNYRLHDTDRDWMIWTRAVVAGVDKREHYLDTLDEIERSSLDYYAALRSLYRQRRGAEIRNSPSPDKTPTPGYGLEIQPRRIELSQTP